MCLKINSVILLFVCFSVAFSVKAEVFCSDKKIPISKIDIKRIGDTMNIQFEIGLAKKQVGSNYKVTLCPYLYTNADTTWLTSRVAIGKNKKKREKQEQLLSGKKGESIIIIPQSISNKYVCEVPYKKWMQNASFGVMQHLEGCCSSELISNEILEENLQIPPVYIPMVEYVSPVVSGVEKKWKFSNEELTIDFYVSKTGIEQELFSNKQTLKEIEDAVRAILNNPSTKLNKIEITGYASPEGTLKHNTELGKDRAKALQYYLQQQISGLPDSIFTLNNGVENWVGLRKMVEASDMEFRNTVLNFIDNTPLTDPVTKESKNNKLKLLEKGNPYRYLLENFYPHLRNAAYSAIIYEETGDKNADMINRAVELIKQDNYQDAFNILLPIHDDSRTWNAIGVCYMMQENEEIAKKWLKKAISMGDKDAERNLNQLEN